MKTFGFGNPDSSSNPPYAREIVDEVWLQAEPIEGNDEALWRRDEFGNHIQRQDYGKFGSPFGWSISETRPGSLKPVHWRNFDSDAGVSAGNGADDGLFPDMPELF